MRKDDMNLNRGNEAVAYTEQRAYKREPYSAPILYEFYKTNNYYQAVVKNRSMGGMCFEADFALPKGVEIFIKLSDDTLSGDPRGKRSGYHAEVRWCRKMNGSHPPKYEVGVNYFEPVLID